MPDKSRFERELDEILEKSEDKKKSRTPRKRQFEPFTTKTPKRKSPVKSGSIRFDSGRAIIFGLVILGIAAFTPFAKLPLAVAGALLVAVGYVSGFRRGGGRHGSGRADERPGVGSMGEEPQVKYWRGRRIEEKPDAPDLTESEDPADRGKIIEFKPPANDIDSGDEDPNGK